MNNKYTEGGVLIMGTELIYPEKPPADLPKPEVKKGMTVLVLIQGFGLYMTLQYTKMIFLGNTTYIAQGLAATVQMI